MSTHKDPPPPGTGNHSPTHAEIAALAYDLHVKRGHPHGHDREDWLEAEQRLRAPAVRDSSPQETRHREGKPPFVDHPHRRDKSQSGRKEIRQMNSSHRPPARDSHQVF